MGHVRKETAFGHACGVGIFQGVAQGLLGAEFVCAILKGNDGVIACYGGIDTELEHAIAALHDYVVLI